MKIRVASFLYKQIVWLTIFLDLNLSSHAVFLSTDELHMNSAPFESFNNDPVNSVDLDGKQPIYLNLVKDEEMAYVNAVIPLSYKDVNLNRVKNFQKYGKEPFLHPDALLPYQDVAFDGRLFIDVHGIGSTVFNEKYFSQHVNYGDLTHEIEQATGKAVKSIYCLGCQSSHFVRASGNRIPGLEFTNRKSPSESIKFRDVPDDVEIFASEYKVIRAGTPASELNVQSSHYRSFLRHNDRPVVLYSETLMHAEFRNTEYHSQIFDRYQNRQFFPAERNFVRTWINQEGSRHFRNRSEFGQFAIQNSEFVPHSVLENVPR